MDNLELATRWSRDWPDIPLEEVSGFFSDDAEYVNMPSPDRVITGAAAIGQVLSGLRARFEKIENTVQAVAFDADTAIIERNERFVTTGGEAFDLPCVGVFKFRDGRIVSWRDYFDRQTLSSFMPPQPS